MAAGDPILGRRLSPEADVRFGELPLPLEEILPGDFWKYDGTANEPTNLTGTVWGFCSPIGGIGTLMKHTVRENEDGTITVAADDGSSNSIMFSDSQGNSWHGYVDAGTWNAV